MTSLFNLIKWLSKALLGRVFWIGSLIFAFVKWLFGSFTMVFAIMRGYALYRVAMKLLLIPVVLTMAFMFLDYGFNTLTLDILNNQSIGSYLTTLISSTPILNNVIVVAGHSGFFTMLSIMFYFFLVGYFTKIVMRLMF